ncbi:DUF1653 domain-containing protein [Colwellia sp. MEBiC06753]
MLTPGKYRHFKGSEYQVLHVAKHSETEEWMVVYYPLYGAIEQTGQPEYWVRPLAMFTEIVERDGKKQPRFALVE